MSVIRNVIVTVGGSMLVLAACGCASRADLDQAHHDNIRISDELSQERAERDQLKQQNADLQKQLEETRTSLKETQTHLAETQDKLKVSEAQGTDAENLRHQLIEAHQNSAEMQKKLAEAQTSSAEAQKQVSSLNARMAAEQAMMNQKLQADEAELTRLRGAQPRGTRSATTRPAEGAP
jgi:chromosome segregation ATPase